MFDNEKMFNKSILIAVDESDNARRAVAYVGRLLKGAKDFNVLILHVIRQPEEDYFPDVAEKEKWLSMILENLDEGVVAADIKGRVQFINRAAEKHTGWSREEARAYMDEAMALPGFSAEVDRYVVPPGQAASYKIGMLKLLELRQRAMDELDEQFDLKEFHAVVLSNGSMPLQVLERVVDDYIAAKLGS